MNSIGKTFTEYLVNFEYFIELMKEYDLELAKPNFKTEYKELFDNEDLKYTDGFGGFEMMIEHLNKLYSKDLSLKQYYPEAFGLLKEKNKLLRELSSLNNWFIFQRSTIKKSKQGVTGETDVEAAADEFGEYLKHEGVEESGW